MKDTVITVFGGLLSGFALCLVFRIGRPWLDVVMILSVCVVGVLRAVVARRRKGE